MKKNKIIILIIAVTIVVAYIIFRIASFSLFEVKQTSLAKLSLRNKTFTVDINFVQSGATNEDIIQIKKVYNNGKEEIIKNFKNYNNLVSCSGLNDSTIQVVLNDTDYYKNKADTFKIIIPHSRITVGNQK